MNTTSVLSWGRAHRFSQDTCAASDLSLALAGNKTLLPYGLGRSYGDSCLNENGILATTHTLDHFLAFDRSSGVLTCEAGVTLRDILLLCAIPNEDGSHWFFPVTPGTKFVTVGGAIANDVHGKNHHRQGTFGNHIVSLKLRRSDGKIYTCSPTSETDLFRATLGGLGLTGLIEEASVQMMRVPGLVMDVEEFPLHNLDDFYELSSSSEIEWDYTVAWVDCLASGTSTGRGLFSRGRHRAGKIEKADLLPKLSVPLSPPFSLIDPLTLRAFNTLYRHKLGRAKIKRSLVPYDGFFYPLDAIGHWNRIYGRKGFYQYQCVIPPEVAPHAIREQLNEISRSDEGSFLIVLKTFGNHISPGMLSFPRSGTTLALDFPNRGASTMALLDRLDALTLKYGGRVYPAKDGRMSSASFQHYYPQMREFSRYVDPRFSSSFWRRVTQEGGMSA